MRFGIHQAIHDIAMEMVREISHAFFSDLREISRCETVPTRNPPPPLYASTQTQAPLNLFLRHKPPNQWRGPQVYLRPPEIEPHMGLHQCASENGNVASETGYSASPIANNALKFGNTASEIGNSASEIGNNASEIRNNGIFGTTNLTGLIG